MGWVERDGKEMLDPEAPVQRIWPGLRRLPATPMGLPEPPELPSVPRAPERPPFYLHAPWALMALVYGLVGPLTGMRSSWVSLLFLPLALGSSFLAAEIQHRWSLSRYRRELQETLARSERRLRRFLEGVEAWRQAMEAWERTLFPPWEDLEARLRSGSDLWFRRPEDPDFLHVRLGLITEPLRPPQGRWSSLDPEEVPPPLRGAAHAVRSIAEMRREVPLGLDLRRPAVLRVFPGQEGTLRRILLEVALAHSPSEVGLFAALADPEWSFLRWLPHTGEEREGWADGPAAVRERIFEEFYRRRGRGEGILPRILLLLDADALGDPRLGELLREGPVRGIHPVLILSPGEPVPGEVRTEAVLFPGGGIWISHRDGGPQEGRDPGPFLTAGHAEALARRLASLRPMGMRPSPRPVPAPALWGIQARETAPEDIQRLRALRGKAPSLAVPLGTEESGEPFVLDLHDRAHGPHAMVIGATGSGKSEALRTLALALALHFPPEQVQLLFIDFKGGGAFAPLEGLPHCVGLLSNLDAREAARALRTLEGELDQRQRVLAARGADHADQIGLPHLVVMADEFAEMLEAIPDGMARMIRLARLGRSLGMHLVLATQRLGSAVPADLRANLRVRIALRCETPDESAAVIGRPDAAYLVGSGWAFVQVGQNEVFRRIRVAYVSGRSLGAREILWMDPADPARRLRREMIGGEARRDLDVLVEALARMDPPAPRRTPPPLPADPGFPEGEGEHGIGIGVADYPEIGEIRWIFLTPSAPDWRLVGQAGTGKTAALMAAAAAAARAGRRVAVVDGDGGWKECPWVLRVLPEDREGLRRLLRTLSIDPSPTVLVLDGVERIPEAAMGELEPGLEGLTGRPELWIWTASRRELPLRPLRGRPAVRVFLALDPPEWEALMGRRPIPEGPFQGWLADGEGGREIRLRRAMGPPPPPAPPLARSWLGRWSELPLPTRTEEGWWWPLGWRDLDLEPISVLLSPRRPALRMAPELVAALDPLRRSLSRVAGAGIALRTWDPEGDLEEIPALKSLPDPQSFLEELGRLEAEGIPWLAILPDTDAFRMRLGYTGEIPPPLRRPRWGAYLLVGRERLELRAWTLSRSPEERPSQPPIAADHPGLAWLSAPGEGEWMLLPLSE
jgi:DNA segregation ATPase FtsK/SpoIIIE-like protein